MLARTTQALASVKQMQLAARALANSGPNNLLPGLPSVPVNSYGQTNGLVVAAGVPADLLNPSPSENASLWSGASLPVATTATASGVTTQTVAIKQTQEQAILNWQSFNIGKNTVLDFDQTAGGADVAQWVAFNKIGVTGSPSQILGSMNAAGQVYLINPNGIIFGGSSQVNAYALVASSLPINNNLIGLGLLNNPDTQFLFSALPIPSGANGTPSFTPVVSDQIVGPSPGASQTTYNLNLNPRSGNSPTVSYTVPGSAPVTLASGTDYVVSTSSNGVATVTFSAAASAAIAGNPVTLSYTPSGDQYGNVVVQAGAQLTSPATGASSGGRMMLVGPNVDNAGTITTPNGQTILAAGLQVGIDAHPTTDPSLRGLDVFIGAVADSTLASPTNEGVATNDRIVNSDGTVYTGLIEAPTADVTMAGATVNQLGFIDSATSVTDNGRIDLLAEFNASPNSAAFESPANTAATTPPFTPLATGVVTMGPYSVSQILPELSSTDQVVGTQLALPSIVDVRGLAIHMASATDSTSGTTLSGSGAVLLAPSAGAAQDQNGNVISESNTRVYLKNGVTLEAGDWNIQSQGTALQSQQFVNDAGQVYLDSGAVIDVSGSSGVSASVDQNIVSVQLRGTELANSPLQQNGALRGQTVQIDLRQSGTYNGSPWVGTPLADTSGYVSIVQRDVGELTTSGGTVSIAAGNSFVLQSGATINVSGGWIDYQPGYVATTQVVSGGHIYDISQATPNIVYNGIYTGNSSSTDTKWNVTQTSANPLPPGTAYDPGYVQGGGGGAISIEAPTMALDGSFLGNTVAGPYQRTSASQINQTFGSTAFLGTMQAILSIPAPSQLNLTFQAQDPSTAPLYAVYSPSPPNVVIKAPPASLNPVPAFSYEGTGDLTDLFISGNRGARGAEVDLSPSLIGSDGFGVLTVDNSGGTPGTGMLSPGGNITIPTDTVLDFQPGGELQLKGGNVDVEGQVSAPGGTLSLTAYDVSPILTYGQVPNVDTTRGTVTIGSQASLNVAGLVVNDGPLATAPGTLPFLTGGGSITVSGFNATLSPGSTLDASGGLDVTPSGMLVYGAGGKIAIAAGRDPGLPPLLGGDLKLGAGSGSTGVDLVGYAGPGISGASLSIQAPLVQVGGGVLENGDVTGANTLWINRTGATGALLVPDFFSQGGFSSFGLSGIGITTSDTQGNTVYLPAVLISSGTLSPTTGDLIPTVIAPKATNWLAQTGSNGSGDFYLSVDPTLLPSGQRAPVSLSFTAEGAIDTLLSQGTGNVIVRGDLVMSAGASIMTDPQTNQSRGVSMSGNTVTVLGSITAPGGTIAIAGSSSPTYMFGTVAETEALPTVDIGPDALLDVSGTTVISYNKNRSLTGTVLSGGTISVSGNIVAEAGSVLDASGWSDSKDATGLLNFPTTSIFGNSGAVGGATGLLYGQAIVDSSGGTINLSGGQELYSDATLLAAAGGPSAQAGSLSVSSGRFYPLILTSSPTSSDVSLVVTGSGPTIPKTFTATGQAVIGNLVDTTDVDSNGNPVAETGHFAASSLNASGIGSLTLGGGSGAVQFLGSSTFSLGRSLSVANDGVISIVPTVTDADPAVILSAPYVFLGTSFKLPAAQWSSNLSPGTLPSYGTGSLSVSATELIDVGDLSLQNIGLAVLNSGAGSIRGNGTLDVAGVLDLTAGQIYPTTAGRFTVAAYDYTPAGGILQPGTVDVASSSSQQPQLPLSAGGQLDIYASDITQDGMLRAPIGTILLGWNGPGGSSVDAAHTDQNTGAQVPTTQVLTMGAGSITSVSASDSKLTLIPYGNNLNGTAWIDPTGADITLSGVPGKSVAINGAQVDVSSGAKIDISGGGNLYAYQWISGAGGTNDVLSPSYVPNPSAPSLVSFAVIPGYQPDYAPYAPYAPNNPNLSSDPGYVANVNQKISVGDAVYLEATNGLPAGFYTVLPARYALLPGGYLVTPEKGTPAANAVVQPDGSSIVGGYVQNSLNPSQQAAQSVLSEFNVALGTAPATTGTTPPVTVVRARSQYADFDANSFLSAADLTAGTAAPNLPLDGGQLVLSADQSLTLKGAVESAAGTGGIGGLVDISSTQSITIGTTAKAGNLLLDPTELSGFGAESLLIGGTRQDTASGTEVTVTANSIDVENPGDPLSGTDIILAASTSITLGKGSVIQQVGSLSGSAETLEFSGSGTVLRVSSDPSASIAWTGATSASAPVMAVGANASVLGASVALESTGAASLDPTATIGGSSSAVTLGSGQISIQLPGSGALREQAGGQTTTGLVLTGNVLQSLEASAALSLVSYSSIDVYGSGTLGSSTLASLALHAPEIHGDGGAAVFEAGTVLMDNSTGSAGADAFVVPQAGTLTGSLTLDAGTIKLGSNPMNVQGYALTSMSATAEFVAQGSSPGEFETQGDLAISTPLVTAVAPSSASSSTSAALVGETISASGNLTLTSPSAAKAASTAGSLGSSLTLVGAMVGIDTDVELPSGTLTVNANGAGSSAGIDVGASAVLDVGGTSKQFQGLTEYSNSGQITLHSDAGSVAIAQGAAVNLASQSGGGNGGTLAVTTPNGSFSVASGTLSGSGGAGGQNGSFSLDADSLPGTVANTSSLAALGTILSDGGFTRAVSLRMRSGDVDVDGTIKAKEVSLSADNGSLTVDGTGVIDASGPTGGTIDLAASGSVTLEAGSTLTVKGVNFNAAGEGGTVSLMAGSPVNGASAPALLGKGPQLSLLSGSTIDLSVTNNLPLQLDTSGTSSLTVPYGVSVSFPTGTPGDDIISFGAAGSLTTSSGVKTTFPSGYMAAIAPGTTVVLGTSAGGGSGTISFASGGTGGSVPLSLPAATSYTSSNVSSLAAFNSAGTLYLRAPQAVDANGNPVDVQIARIDGTIVGPSSVVAEGDAVFTPAGGVIDTVEAAVRNNGAIFAGGIDATGTVQPGNTAAIDSRLLASNPAIATVFHVQPGAEIVNAADPSSTTTLTLNNGSSSVSLPSNTTLQFPSGGTQMTFSSGGFVTGASGTVTTAGGSTTSFSASQGATFAAGSTISLSGPGSVTLSAAGTVTTGGPAGSTPLSLPSQATYALSGANSGAINSAGSNILTFATSGFSGDSTTLAAGQPIAFPSGTPGSDKLRSSQSGFVVSPSGTETSFNANSSNITVPAGGYVVLNSPGTLSFASGTTPISLALANGAYSTGSTSSVTLNGAGNFVSLPAMTPIQFAGGSAAMTVSSAGTISGGAGTITTPDGTTTAFAAGSNPTFTAGSTLVFTSGGSVSLATAGNVALAGGSGGIGMTLPAGTSYALGGSGGTTLSAADGLVLDLSSSGAAANFAANTPIAFPNGTPGTDLLSSSQAGVVVSASGAKTPFAASSSNISVPSGGYVVLNAPGTLSFSSGTIPIPLALSEGTYSTKGLASATTIALSNTGSELELPAMTAVTVPGSGSAISFTSSGTVTGGAGTITAPGGSTTPFTSGSNPTFAAGSTVTFTTPGSVSLTSAGGVAAAAASSGVAVSIPQNTVYTVAGAAGSTLLAGNGELLSLPTSGVFGSSASFGAGVPIAFPSGTPGKDLLRSDQSGIVVAPSGAITPFVANSSNIVVPLGGYIVLNAPGTIGFASGTAPITLALSEGLYTTSGATSLTASPGNLTLAASWDLSTFRFGPSAIPATPATPMTPVTPIPPGTGEPGTLTLRASGNLVFNSSAGTTSGSSASLSDGFDPSNALLSQSVGEALWTAPLLPAGSRSWSYNLVAGADWGAADASQVMPLAGPSALPPGVGSVLIGSGAVAIPFVTSATTSVKVVPGYYQTIRTGTGSIDVNASDDVQLLDPLATIYTAGTQAPLLSDFTVPILNGKVNRSAPASQAPYYPAEYSYGGGDVSVEAQHDIASYVQTSSGLVMDSTAELPDTWLYRRGSLNGNGLFDTIPNLSTGNGGNANDVTSTSWWINFSNFFEGVGALGGGNVALIAGNDVANVDAVVPTNLRMTGVNSSGVALLPAEATSLELGGGNLTVQAGADINGGVYYVERGLGSVGAGGSIITNATRAALLHSDLAVLASSGEVADASTWLPTTLFVGQSSFDVTSNGSLLLGPVSNPFLLPQNVDNGYYYKSYFSTYSFASSVSASSLGGDVTLADSGNGSTGSLLSSWVSNMFLEGRSFAAQGIVTFSQPWLSTLETSPSEFATVESIMPPTLSALTFGGNINLVGNLTLSPSPVGEINLLASGSVNGLQPNGVASPTDPYNAKSNPFQWEASVVNLSDANPGVIPGTASPFGLSSQAVQVQQSTSSTLFTQLDSVFSESGATSGSNVVLQTQETLHGSSPTSGGAAEPLHYGDTDPVHVLAVDGSISGFTMYSPKSAQVEAGADITDMALYIQNVNASDQSLVSAGRDIILYDPNSPLRLEAQTIGNNLTQYNNEVSPGSSTPAAGDVQISGPGTLEVMAGRNLNVGTGGPVTTNGLADGITSIGNTRNPLLGFAGANVVVGAGLGAPGGLESGQLDFTDSTQSGFVDQFLNPITGGSEAARYLPDLGAMMGTTGTEQQIWSAFNALTVSQQDLLALNVFYLVLRDAGRDRNNPLSPNYGNYNAGSEAIAALFGKGLDYANSMGTGFEDEFLNPTTGGAQSMMYLPELAALAGLSGTDAQVWSAFEGLPAVEQRALALKIFADVLADAAQQATVPATAAAGNATLTQALSTLFTGETWSGDILIPSHEIKTSNGGNIAVFAPGGLFTVGYSTDIQTPDQGVLTDQGGNISIYTQGNVSLGTSRIFTLSGGNVTIWSTAGNIAAGSGSKTVHSAPPTRVLVNPQSANVQNDLAGLATGSGIGVLETLAGVAPGDVDLIAPVGTVDAGDAGIRASGNLNIAARVVLNASNIQVGGSSAGLPPPAAAPNIAGLAAASSVAASSESAAAEVSNNSQASSQVAEVPSLISVDILGYGGSDDDSGSDQDDSDTPAKKKKN
jgi:filamentous hemagglutinin family protein